MSISCAIVVRREPAEAQNPNAAPESGPHRESRQVCIFENEACRET